MAVQASAPKTCASCKVPSESGRGYRSLSVFDPAEYCPACFPKQRVRSGRFAWLVLYPLGLLVTWGVTVKAPSDPVAWGMLHSYAILILQSVTILPHELGHAVASRLVGMTVHRIVVGIGPRLLQVPLLGGTLEIHAIPWGGFTQLSDPRPKGLRARFFVGVAGGPLVNFLLLLAALPALHWPHPVKAMLSSWQPLASFAGANLLVLVWNLLPRHISSIGRDSDGLLLLKTPFMSSDKIRQMVSSHYLLGGLKALATEDYAAAARWNEQGLAISSDSVPLRVNLGVAYLNQGFHERAREEFKQVILSPAPVDPDLLAFVRNNLGVVSLLLDRPELLEEAEQEMALAMRQTPWSPFIRGTTGAVWIVRGKLEGGVVLCQEAFERHDDPKAKAAVACHLALGLKAKGQEEKGAAFLEAAERLYPKCPFLPRTRKAYGRSPDPQH